MSNEQRIQQLEKSYRKCPDVLHGPGRRSPDLHAQERIAAHIRQGKLTAHTYRGKRLIGKIDLLEFPGATDEPAVWAGKIKPGGRIKEKKTSLMTELLPR